MAPRLKVDRMAACLDSLRDPGLVRYTSDELMDIAAELDRTTSPARKDELENLLTDALNKGARHDREPGED